MAKLIDSTPDRIEERPSGQRLYYFTGGKNFVTLPPGSKYVIVYEPTAFNTKWRAVLYEIMPAGGDSTWIKEIKARPLTNEEVAYFEGLIGS